MFLANIHEKAYAVLKVDIAMQVERITKSMKPSHISANKTRKRKLDDITNENVTSLLSTATGEIEPKKTDNDTNEDEDDVDINMDMDDEWIIKEVNRLLASTHILKQWYLSLLQKGDETEKIKETLSHCKVLQKGLHDAETHAINILDHIQAYHFKRLELLPSATAQNQHNCLDKPTVQRALYILDRIYKVRVKHMIKEILSIYLVFMESALKLLGSEH